MANQRLQTAGDVGEKARLLRWEKEEPTDLEEIISWASIILPGALAVVVVIAGLRRIFLADIEFPADARALEVGCGTGVLTRVIARRMGATAQPRSRSAITSLCRPARK